jgi:hypothetical protein
VIHPGSAEVRGSIPLGSILSAPTLSAMYAPDLDPTRSERFTPKHFSIISAGYYSELLKKDLQQLTL